MLSKSVNRILQFLKIKKAMIKDHGFEESKIERRSLSCSQFQIYSNVYFVANNGCSSPITYTYAIVGSH